MNTNINSPEFWEQVKQDFTDNPNEHFLCGTSDVFSDAYAVVEQKQLIKDFAADFLKIERKWLPVFYFGTEVLFMHALIGVDHYADYREIRFSFLDYMINRTKNEQPTI